MLPIRWKVQHPPEELVEKISRSLMVSPLLARVLINRGVNDEKTARDFLNPRLTNLFNPFLLPDIDKAVKRLRQAIEKKEKVLVYGDRDTDGISAICVVVRTLQLFGLLVDYYIPSDEGYGLNKEVIRRYHEQGINLILTVDCGISALEEISFANQLGIDVIVTDHHEPPAVLPSAVAVIDPKRTDSHYPFPHLAGCSVAFKLMQALLYSFNQYYDEPIVALDIETTGLNPRMDEVIEVGAAVFCNGVIQDKFHSLVKPEKATILPGAEEKHHLKMTDLNAAPEPAEVIKRLADFIGNRRILLHNADFVLGFLNQYWEKYLARTIDNDYIDTLLIARQYFPFRSYSLVVLAEDLEIESKIFHRALPDALTVIEAFRILQEKQDRRLRFFLEDNLDVLCLGTIADIMPLVLENRILVHFGLEKLPQTRKIGLRKLLDWCQSERSSAWKSRYISWNVVPLLNACGRMQKATIAAELLLTDNPLRADELLEEIISLNESRRELQAFNSRQFQPLLKSCCKDDDKIFVVTAEGLEHGVTGILAGQLVRQYNRPVILLIAEGEKAVGAARAPNGFDLVKALESTSDLLEKYGGHRSAAGLTIAVKNIEEFRRRIKAYAEKVLTEEEMAPVLWIDAEITLAELNPGIVRELEWLEPFGGLESENPSPQFLIRNLQLIELSRVGVNQQHIRLRLRDSQNNLLTAFFWNRGADWKNFAQGMSLDIVGQPEINIWQNKETLQFILSDVAPA